MTIVVDSRDVPARQVEANLYKLVNVVDVQDVTNQQAIVSAGADQDRLFAGASL